MGDGEVGKSAGVAFLEAMESVAPGDPEGAFAQLMNKPSFRNRFLAPEWRDGMGKAAVQERVLKTPFVAEFVKVYHQTRGFRAKRQLLSIFAPHFPYNVTRRVFGIGRKLVYLARLHAGEYGGARPVPPSLTSYRIRPEAAEGVTAFVSKPEFTQVLASAPGIHSTAISELTIRPEKLWRKYDAATPDGPGKVSRSQFLAYLDQPCFRLQTSKSCLCGPCEEHGWQNFEDLETLIKALHLGAEAERGFLVRLRALRDYLKHTSATRPRERDRVKVRTRAESKFQDSLSDDT